MVINIPFIEYLNKQIYNQIKDEGADKSIVFIHGSGGNSNVWVNQFNLKINYNLISIDLPSHSQSDSFDNLSFDLYTGVLRHLVNTLNLKNVILCGHSLGGAIIQDYYFKYPNEVLGLILVGTGGRLRVSPIILQEIKNNYANYVENLLPGAFFRKTSKEIINQAKIEASKVKPEVIHSDFSICDGFDTLNKTATIKIPCLVLCGEEDSLTPVKYSKFFHDKLQISELSVIKEAGHMVMIEKQNEVNNSIEEFISKYF